MCRTWGTSSRACRLSWPVKLLGDELLVLPHQHFHNNGARQPVPNLRLTETLRQQASVLFPHLSALLRGTALAAGCLGLGPALLHEFPHFLFCFCFFNFYWSIVDLQCCVSFRCTGK